MDENSDSPRMRISDEILGGRLVGLEVSPDEIDVAHFPFTEPIHEVMFVKNDIAAEAIQKFGRHE